ncbi:MAG: hypothetical protein KDI61_12115 [Alphaproteobacteria bacterium]|nr:hypothetical protein [Alphaproteobacteria bacterium]MCB1840987.1 hypothetical protein [Alphaproteobacteria bacterium]
MGQNEPGGEVGIDHLSLNSLHDHGTITVEGGGRVPEKALNMILQNLMDLGPYELGEHGTRFSLGRTADPEGPGQLINGFRIVAEPYDGGATVVGSIEEYRNGVAVDVDYFSATVDEGQKIGMPININR